MPNAPAGARSPVGVPEAVSWRGMGSSEPLFTRVAEQVERFIAGNGLTAGDRLPGERDLCRLLGVSRASVREALRSLQARGLVDVRHGKGVFVAERREIGMDELFAMREVLEVPAAGWAATAATDEQLRVVEQAFEELEEAVLGRSPARELQALDSRLHLLIAEYASNRFLAMTQSALQEMLVRSMETTLAIPGRPARSLREHAEIVQALGARDPVRARAAARRHIRSAHRAAVRRMSSDPGSRS
jgi:GntR family transcriptional regulator, transcriptional repressor for pyruvate dehydrogenase complex